MRRILLAAAIVIAAASAASRLAAQIQPLCVKGCLGPRMMMTSNGFVATPRAPESGPFSYTVTFLNNGDETAYGLVRCNSTAQLPCSASPMDVTLAPWDEVTVTFTYSTRGAGSFRHTVAWDYTGQALRLQQGEPSGGSALGAITLRRAAAPAGFTAEQYVQAAIQVGPPMQVHVQPFQGQPITSADSIIAWFSHPTGITQASLKVIVDGVQRTASSGPRGDGIALWIPGLSLPGGPHVLATYGCATNGRCDSLTTTFEVPGPPVNYAVDDSLPPAQGEGQFGLLPGALPLPPQNLRGCPVNPSDPDILLTSPFTYTQQGGATPGYIFLPGIFYGNEIEIGSLTVDNLPSNTRTCATLTYLDMEDYDWSWWSHSDPNDPLRSTYPYADGPLTGGGGAGMLALEGGNPARGGAAGVPNGSHRPDAHYGPGYTPRPGGVVIQAENPGAINPNSYRVELNGTLIVINGNPVSGVIRDRLELLGSTYRISATHALVNTSHPDFPFDPDSSPNGGWNEIVASIADSSGNRTYVRARFAVLKPGGPKPLGITALRDFRRGSESDCAAFGPFQCGGVTVAQTIPGFVSRDRQRSLHLVYRSNSAGAPVVMPVQIDVRRENLAPDSLELWTIRNGVPDSLVTRYAGTQGNAGGYTLLWENANETRVAAAVVPRATGADPAVFQRVTVTVRAHFFTGGGHEVRDTSATLEMIRPLWMDTVTTRFGAGWNLAELGRLAVVVPQAGQRRAVYQSGDGSFVVYRDSSGIWLAPPGVTSRLVDTTMTGGDTVIRQVLYLNNGASLGFDAFGRQRWTMDLVGNKTLYRYTGNTSRLINIEDPTTSQFAFNYTGGRIASIDVRQAGGAFRRMVDLAYTGERLTRFVQWIDSTHSDTTQFRYETGAPFALLDTIVDPRGQYSTIGYDPVHFTPWWMTRPAGNPGLARGTAVFRDTWRRMVPRNGYGTRPYTGSSAQPLERLLFPNQARGTFFGYAGRPVDFQVDQRGAPTVVRPVPTEAVITPEFLIVTYPNQPTRTISRDSAGRVIRIVSRMDTLTGAAMTGEAVDSVMYEYNALGEVARIIRATQAYPLNPAQLLDTTSFTYDQIQSGWMSARCTRMLTATDPFGAVTTTTYGSTGVGRCLPVRVVGPTADTTIFGYGTLNPGAAYPWATRPTSVRDPLGVTVSIQYQSAYWNASQTVRTADNATTRIFYNAYGYADSVVSPTGIATVSRHDKLGRAYLQRTGTGLGAPVTSTHFSHGGLVDTVRVYGTTGSVEGAPGTAVQLTRYHYNALGWRDTLMTPGGRRVVRRLFDGFGNPVWEYPGNGSYMTHLYDGDGRPTSDGQSQVYPGFSLDGQPFANARDDALYRSFGMVQNRTLAGVRGSFRKYDVNGRLAQLNDSVLVRRYAYSARGALVSDTLDFLNGPRVVRFYTYNRRGQRASVVDTVWRNGVRIGYGRTNYGYDAFGRLDTMVAYRDSAAGLTRIGHARWLYHRAGHDTLRVVTLESAGDGLRMRTALDAAGRVAERSTRSVNANKEWYRWSPSYDLDDRVGSFGGTAPTDGQFTEGSGGSYTYEAGGTGRLLVASYTGTGTGTRSQTWLYDVFGNRHREYRTQSQGGCPGVDTLTYGSDSELRWWRQDCGTWRYLEYATDRSGNRLAEVDTVTDQPRSLMSYTARGQLYFSMTPTASVSNYDYNWHWYDGNGLRVLTHRQLGSGWVPGTDYQDNGNRTYYVYDGADVALTIGCGATSCSIDQRVMSGGVDQPLAGWFRGATGTRALMFVADAQGSTRAALRADGLRETDATLWSRDPFGGLQGASGTGGAYNTETGFAGASTPNSTGGFTYLRNRWYDPATGRFLTQDPIGLAGGVNLYAYAGNNPISFSDPFGLCPPEDNTTPCTLGDVWRGFKRGMNAWVGVPDDGSPGYNTGRLVGMLSFMLPAARVGAVAEVGTAVSTIRRTTAGEAFEHYGYAAQAENFAGGMRAGSFATSASGLAGAEARSSLALPRAIAPDASYTVRPAPGTLVRSNPVVRRANGQPGGGSEVEFLLGTEPGTVGAPKPVP